MIDKYLIIARSDINEIGSFESKSDRFVFQYL